MTAAARLAVTRRARVSKVTGGWSYELHKVHCKGACALPSGMRPTWREALDAALQALAVPR